MKKIMHAMMLSCLKATRRIEKKHAHGLNPLENMQLKLHTGMCAACRSFEQQSLLIDKAASALIEADRHKEHHISEDSKTHIIKSLEPKH